MRPPLLQVKNLKKYFPIHRGLFRKVVGNVKAVDDVSFDLFPQEHSVSWASQAAEKPLWAAPCFA